MAILQSTLRNKAANHYRHSTAIQKSLNENFSRKKTAFLCHSHKDEELVKGLLVIFQESGVELYVDWKDHTMPEVPNGETAKKIQEKIQGTDVFLFLATANSKASRWCPWEIGYADSRSKGIYIVPTSDGMSTYGNEYLQLYSNIDSGYYQIDGRPGYFVANPGETGYAISNSRIV